MGMQGMNKLDDILADLGRDIESEIGNVLEEFGDRVVDAANALVPVDTGELKRSIKAVKHSNLELTVGAHTDYAEYVEYGTRKMRAQPYMEPAVDENIDWLENQLGKIIDG